mmetsp:Transcript_26575/g.37336  ORF Transcript_26575/g.37336 Transcript_26575/m.37336 type:complete len:130 (+) Transcript_26575:2106-2495(+)
MFPQCIKKKMGTKLFMMPIIIYYDYDVVFGMICVEFKKGRTSNRAQKAHSPQNSRDVCNVSKYVEDDCAYFVVCQNNNIMTAAYVGDKPDAIHHSPRTLYISLVQNLVNLRENVHDSFQSMVHDHDTRV